MVFSSITFLFFFLPAVLAFVALSPKKLRNTVLLLASLVFYAWGSQWFVIVLVATSALDYYLVGQRWLKASVVLNLSVLAYFKYAGFFAVDVVGAFTPFDNPPAWLTNVVLPIGISFFTFQRISYAVDVISGREEPVNHFGDYMLYIVLFPQLIAGPIVRYSDISAQLKNRSMTMEGFSDGSVRFALGLSKKVLIADSLGPVADAVFASDAGNITTPAAILGTVAYTLQLYFDFSGYSDMAIGLGRILGFTFPENFNRPYTAVSVTDFWRRWHMTLSFWFRDYVYIPLGGSRTGHTTRNLIIVFLLTGLWHGAAWTFVVWGAYHGSLLLLERKFGGRLLPGVGGRIITLVLVMFGWIVFRAPDFTVAAEVFTSLFAFDFGPVSPAITRSLETRALVVLLGASLVFFQPGRKVAGDANLLSDKAPAALARTMLLGVGMPAALLVAASQSFSPFLYFQF